MWCILKSLTKNHNQLDKTHNKAGGCLLSEENETNVQCMMYYLLIAATYQYLKQYYVLYTQVGSCSFKFAYRKSNILFWISIVHKLRH